MPSCDDRYELSKADTQTAKGVAMLSWLFFFFESESPSLNQMWMQTIFVDILV